ncbi:MAG: Stp1/IreP family PP2C-type Ser/Thr phosphatase [Elusimicrobiales bacterium]|nr:Stp1/IreP family PP2C-type Ser/Thr phosphatase [Elusimicrobiales bacterium]
MKFEYYGITDKGKIRLNNEDSFVIDNEINFVAIADGMGGHKSGEIASNLAVSLTLSNLKKYLDKNKSFSIINRDYLLETNLLVSAVSDTNIEIFTKAQEEEYKGMGTTLTCALFTNSIISIVHIGDSRAYLIRNEKIHQLTEDDSFVMEQYKSGKITLKEMETSPFKHVLTKALGIKKENSYFIKEEKIYDGDIILFTTDGLTKMLSDEEIEKIINTKSDIQTAAYELINIANMRGGEDNITLIIVKVNNLNIIKKIKGIFK